MAGDTRDAAAPPPSGNAQSQNAQSQPTSKPESANLLADRAAINTAGGGRTDVSFMDAAKTIRIEEFASIHQKPCVRDGLLTGMGVGFGAGGLATVLGSKYL